MTTSIARSAFCRHVGLWNFALRGRANGQGLVAVVSRGGIKEGARPGAIGFGSGIKRYQSSVASSVSTSPSTSTSTPASTTLPSSESSSPSPTSKPSKSNPFTRALVLVFASALCFTAGFTMAAAPTISSGVSAVTAVLDPPTDAETLEMFTPSTAEVEAIERSIFDHPLTKSLLADPKYIASRPHLKVPIELRSQSLTGGTLLGPDMIASPPLQFATEDGSTFVSLQYLGQALCGHPGIVHGGLLATLLDEGTARCCFPALPNKVAVTASLKIDYKYPTMAGQVVVLKAETTKVEGRKAWVKGRLETLVDESKGEVPVVLVEAEALFIEPRNAASMKKIVPT